MNVIVFAEKPYRTAHALDLFADVPNVQVVCYMSSAARRLEEDITCQELHVADDANMRLWAQKHLMEKGEWYVLVDSHVKHVTRVHDEHLYARKCIDFEAYDDKYDWQPQFDFKVEPWQVINLIDELIGKCKEVGTTYGGFADCLHFRGRSEHWLKRAVVPSKLCVWKHTGIEWLYHDLAMTAGVLAKSGCVVVNQFARAVYERDHADAITASLHQRYPWMVTARGGLRHGGTDWALR